MVRLCWVGEGKPTRVVIVKKKNNDDATATLLEIAAWLRSQGISVLVEPDVFEELQSDLVETWNEEVLFSLPSHF